MKYFKQFLGRIFEKFISYWTCFHSPHRSFSDTCVSQCTGYCDNRCPFFIRYFYSIACRQQWRRKENIAALRTCQAYTRVDRHMICSYKDCHPWRYFLQSSYTLSMMIVTSTSTKRISGCPFMSVHISTRISNWMDFTDHYVTVCGLYFQSLFRLRFCFPPNFFPKLSFINLNRRH